jgi:hypothetical protein
MKGREFLRVAICAGTVWLLDSPPIFSAPAEIKPSSVAVSHPNLLLNQEEIAQIRLKIREQPWAARLVDRVKAKAEKDGPAVEAALAYVLTGQTMRSSEEVSLSFTTRKELPQ